MTDSNVSPGLTPLYCTTAKDKVRIESLDICRADYSLGKDKAFDSRSTIVVQFIDIGLPVGDFQTESRHPAILDSML